MIDRLYNHFSSIKDKPVSDFDPSKAIRKKYFLNQNAGSLVVIFPGWHTHNFPVNILARRLIREGKAVVYYDFDNNLLAADEDKVKKSFMHIRDSIKHDLEEINKSHHYAETSLVGVSLGGLTLGLIASVYQKFDSATFVVSGDYLAVNTWYGLRTEKIRQQFQRLHVSFSNLEKDWAKLAPIEYAKYFSGKRVKILIGKYDSFILTEHQERLAKALKSNASEIEIKRVRAGHVVTGILFYLFGKPL